VIFRGSDIPPDLLEFFEPANEAAMRDTWTLSPEPFPAAHFATFPTEIPRRAIKAGTSEKGACAACGAPWRRVVERATGDDLSESNGSVKAIALDASGYRHGDGMRRGPGTSFSNSPTQRAQVSNVTTGWQPSCSHDAAVVPCVVLDPFLGSGTTGLVADELGRDCIGIELNPEYASMSRERIYGAAPMFAAVEVA
jgi:hypothetical protein